MDQCRLNGRHDLLMLAGVVQFQNGLRDLIRGNFVITKVITPNFKRRTCSGLDRTRILIARVVLFIVERKNSGTTRSRMVPLRFSIVKRTELSVFAESPI